MNYHLNSSKRMSIKNIHIKQIITFSFVLLLSVGINTQKSFAAPTDLPLMTIQNLEYKGGFRVPGGTFGESDFSYTEGKITLGENGNSIFMVGHAHQQAIAEISIPTIINSTNIADFQYASIVQNFSRILNRAETGNPQQIDRISGMEYYKGKLVVNGFEYYDGDGNATHTTLVVDEASNLSNSSISGFYGYDAKAMAAGWISSLDSSWHTLLGGTHITGNSSGQPIITRLSVGPSAYSFNLEQDLINTSSGSTVPTTRLSSFTLDDPMGDVNNLNSSYLENSSRNNKMWTHISNAVYGFVVPGTRTYATFGSSGGHDTGVGYKITQDDGSLCAGYCPRERSDTQNYYWLFDLNDLIKVKTGVMNAKDIAPYEYGELSIPNQPYGFVTMAEGVLGGAFDSDTNTLYLSVYGADNLQSAYAKYPIIVAYQLSIDGTGSTGGSDGGGSDGGTGSTEPPSNSLAIAPPNFTATSSTTTSEPPSDNTEPPSDTDNTLPPPTGTVVNVSNNSELQTAVSNLSNGTTIMLAPGTYNLSSTLYITKDNISIRGQTNNANDVVLKGKGMEVANFGNVPHGIWSDASNLTVANLTIQDVYHNGIILNPGAEEPLIHNVHLIDTGEQFIKANPVAFGDGVDRGIVQYSRMEYSVSPPNTDHGGGTGYTNGIDVHAGHDWIIRYNTFKNFHTPDSADVLWAPAVLMWNGAQGTITQSNTFINVDRAIAYGLTDRSTGNDHSGGMIKNNMIYYAPQLYSSSRSANSDASIIVWDSPQTKVYHNTVLTNGNLNKAIEFRFNTAGAEAKNNLVDAYIGERNGGTFSSTGNLQSATASMFVNPAIGDLHLLSTATSVIDKVSYISEASSDFDGESRPQSNTVDIGADERN